MNSCSSDETTANDRITICMLQKSDKSNLTVGFKCKPFAIDHPGNKLASFFSINLKNDEIPMYFMNKLWPELRRSRKNRVVKPPKEPNQKQNSRH